jgi:hypothetical protein
VNMLFSYAPLQDQISRPDSHLTLQHLISVFCHLDHMILDIIDRVTTFLIAVHTFHLCKKYGHEKIRLKADTV